LQGDAKRDGRVFPDVKSSGIRFVELRAQGNGGSLANVHVPYADQVPVADREHDFA
jgi:hypothetical protein